MRLSKPSFDLNLPVYVDMDDMVGGMNPVKTSGLESFGLAEFLTLPHTFG